MHMVQHLLLTLVGPPLLLLAGPITLLLQASSPETRRRWILPVLHSSIVRRRVASRWSPWILFAAVMWASHFSPLFNVALEDPWVHRLEHALFLGAALLFWWPVIGPDPSPWKLRPPASILYVGLQMPQNTFLALAIYMASAPLYAHYATTIRTWGPTPLEDQQAAGGIMWVGGDIMFVTMLVAMTWRVDAGRGAAQRRRGPAARGGAGGDPGARGAARGAPGRRGTAAAAGSETGSPPG